MTPKQTQALASVAQDIQQKTPEQFRAEMESRAPGDIALALGDLDAMAGPLSAAMPEAHPSMGHADGVTDATNQNEACPC